MRIKLLLFIVNSMILITLVQSKLALKQVVILNRHGLRTPVSKNLNQVTPKVWPKWDQKPGILTEKGETLVGYMGSYLAAWLRKEGVLPSKCPTEDDLYVQANTMERTLKSAESIIKKGFPDCHVTVHHTNLKYLDPLFNPVIHNTTASFKKEALHQMQAVLNSFHLKHPYKVISRILKYKNSKSCKVDKKCNLAKDKNDMEINPGHKPKLAGPLNIGNSVIDAFYMENYEGFPSKDVAWGMLPDEKSWQSIILLNRAYYNVTFSTTIIARDIAEPLVKHISKLLLEDEKAPKVTLLVGHEPNLRTVFKTIEVKPYNLHKQHEKTPVGSALVFQKWEDDETKKSYFKLNYIYQSTEQLRHASVLTLDSPPQIKILELEACQIDKNGFCPWDDFKTFMNNLY